MTFVPSNAQPAVARSLTLWHEMVTKKDLSQLLTIVHPDVTFRSPVAMSPYHSAQALVFALTTVFQVFNDFAYHRHLVSDDGLNIVLEFSARVGDKNLKGIDLIRFDEQGLIVDFEVIIRPLSGLQALAAEMGPRVSQHLPAFKGKA